MCRLLFLPFLMFLSCLSVRSIFVAVRMFLVMLLLLIHIIVMILIFTRIALLTLADFCISFGISGVDWYLHGCNSELHCASPFRVIH